MNEKRNNLQILCNDLAELIKLNSTVIDTKGEIVTKHISNNIPEELQADYPIIIERLLECDKHQYYYFNNTYGLEYVAAGIWKSEILHSILVVGPFLSNVPNSEFMSKIFSNNNISISERKRMQEFYSSLHIVTSNYPSSVGNLLCNLCERVYSQNKMVISESIQMNDDKEHILPANIDNTRLIEERYKKEKRILKMIASGNKKEMKQFIESSSEFYFDDRFPESPVRSLKNLLFVLNTLCRTAAEKGGVHPLFIHNLSEKFAVLIERATTIAYLKKLQMVLLEEYCELVYQYSTAHFSEIVKQTIHFIDLHIEQELSLKFIAAEIHTNASYLSRKFKEEKGISITEYINEKRIEAAKFYLLHETTSITDVAFLVGYNDINYFSRVFKKITGKTPREYKKPY